MDKKIILIGVIVFILCLGAVSAAKLDSKKFGDDFSIKVPKGSNFVAQKQNMNGTDGFFNKNMSLDSYMDNQNQIMILYSSFPMISEDSADMFYQMMFQNMNPGLDSCYETQDGDLKFLKPIKKSSTNMALAGFNKGNKTVMVIGTDYDLVYDMGKTIKFS